MQSPREILLKAAKFHVERRQQTAADGTTLSREIVVHPGAVVLLPLLDDGRVVLIRNYRVAVEQTLIELPAGTLEPGEDPARTAARELLEETGYRAARIEPLVEFFMSPGILNERMLAYVATGLTPGNTALELGEEIEPLVVTWEESLRLIETNQIRDSKTIATLLFYDRFRR